MISISAIRTQATAASSRSLSDAVSKLANRIDVTLASAAAANSIARAGKSRAKVGAPTSFSSSFRARSDDVFSDP